MDAGRRSFLQALVAAPFVAPAVVEALTSEPEPSLDVRAAGPVTVHIPPGDGTRRYIVRKVLTAEQLDVLVHGPDCAFVAVDDVWEVVS